MFSPAGGLDLKDADPAETPSPMEIDKTSALPGLGFDPARRSSRQGRSAAGYAAQEATDSAKAFP
jgi:hypothetical protein